MAKVFVFDYESCNGCYNCQLACKDEHCEQAWMPYAKEQPLTGQFWCKLNERVRGQVPVVKVSYQPVLCNHCVDAPCIAAGNGAVYRRDDGLVIIDPDKAVGMKELADSCPIGAIYYNEALDLPQKCTGCAHLLDNGWEVPRCVDACPHEALRYVEESEVDLTNAQTLDELEGCGPRMYYLNTPKRFIAGTVVDVAADEVVIGADVTVTSSTGVKLTLVTDDFGDFWFKKLDPDVYTLSVNGLELEVDIRDEDKCVGDLDVSA